MDDKRRLILDQALALVDERGLAAMSMRAVAERVGLTSMALYPYVGGKDALLDGLVDLLTIELGTEFGDDPAGIDWRQRLRALGRAVRRLAHAHPGAFPLLLNRRAAGASASWLTAALRGVLHDAGAPPDQVPRLARMICAFLLGYTTGEVTGGLPPAGSPAPAGEGLGWGETVEGGLGWGETVEGGLGSGETVEGGPTARRPAAEGLGGGELAAEGPGAGEPGARKPAADERGEGRSAAGRAAQAEFDADLDDLVRLVEVAVRAP